ncbi:MAG: hypothetical protein LUO93_02410 [Methanomicrobiales archaeon]|nr:hypothetical protein [Methanomicrobiales archaeon]
MGLDDHVHFRISKWERSILKKYRWDASVIFRQAFLKKYREAVNDPVMIISDGESGPAAIYIQAWNRIMPAFSSILSKEDFLMLKNSEEKLEDLKRVISLQLLKPIEIQHLGVFLQGGNLSERILINGVDEHLREEVNS